MQKYIYKLNFSTPVRFGLENFSSNLSRSSANCHCDTFFSAICNSWIRIFGAESLNEFIKSTKDNKFLISDMFPYKKDELFVPKPKIIIEKATISNEDEPSIYSKKEMKTLSYIPVSKFKNYMNFLLNGTPLEFEFNQSFCEEICVTKTAISGLDNSLPYLVSAKKFHMDCGLYFILETTNDIKTKFDVIIEDLGHEGIGGKRSSGYGKFNLREKGFALGKYESDIELNKLLNDKSSYYMSLSTITPTLSDIESIDIDNSYYSILKRSGFVYSDNYTNNHVKKCDLFMFDHGSCFNNKLTGDLIDVAFDKVGKHPVYRYGLGMWIGAGV